MKPFPSAISRREHYNWHKQQCPNILILYHNFDSTSVGCLQYRRAEAVGDGKSAQGWQMALDLKAAVVLLPESLQQWSVLLLEGGKDPHFPI